MNKSTEEGRSGKIEFLRFINQQKTEKVLLIM